MQNSNTKMKNNNKKRFLIEERRRRVTSLLAQSKTETEIATETGVHVSTVCRDVKYLKKQCQRFVYDLAKSDLAFCYKQCLDGIEEVKRKCWDMYNENELNNQRDKLFALKLIKECNEGKFTLLKEGPSIMNLQSLETRLRRLESRQID